jgi:formylmethanofuran dehydrogenase subunit E
VDAIQVLTGCTYGKGNLIHKDYGKNAYTFFRRSDGRAIRVMTKRTAWGPRDDEHRTLFARVRAGEASAEEKARFQELHIAKSEVILNAPRADLFTITEMNAPLPKRARIHTAIQCEECGEHTMETRIRRFGERHLCIPCFEKAEAR